MHLTCMTNVVGVKWEVLSAHRDSCLDFVQGHLGKAPGRDGGGVKSDSAGGSVLTRLFS